MRIKFASVFFLIISVLTFMNFRYYNNSTVLDNVGYGHKKYLTASSTYINEASGNSFFENIKSESCYIAKEGFDAEVFIKQMGGRIVFVENINEGTIYYAYSSKILYKAKASGEIVNLQVFVGQSTVKVGTPLIYESF